MSSSSFHQSDADFQSGGTGEPAIGGDHTSSQALRQSHVEGISEGEVRSQVPGRDQQWRERKAPDRRASELAETGGDPVLGHLAGTSQAAQCGEHLGIEMRRSRDDLPAQALPSATPGRGTEEELDRGGRVEHQHGSLSAG